MFSIIKFANYLLRELGLLSLTHATSLTLGAGATFPPEPCWVTPCAFQQRLDTEHGSLGREEPMYHCICTYFTELSA